MADKMATAISLDEVGNLKPRNASVTAYEDGAIEGTSLDKDAATLARLGKKAVLKVSTILQCKTLADEGSAISDSSA